MKNKKPLYILPFVVVIWSIVIYRVYDYTDTSTYSYNPGPSSIRDSTLIVVKPFDYTLLLDYKDPFEITKPVRKHSVKTSPKTPVAPPSTPVTQNVTRDIIYSGLIENPSAKERVVLIKIDGQTHMIKEGDEVAGVKVIKVSVSSIEVEVSGIRSTISK
ncbi:hypothetical protein LVD17_19005 [Fulvivirga ulvae]|uniref:hypothetical protein n=1 Tax=Fulvivirga ulvae TaxID=2904245 RepID=UPI001F2F946C|nr:hypothetical protein [Fulvivirga ulvae]UII30383.1 hypothetical protein LVD17_19005 [Fulvivirga ulvae]